MDSRAPDKGLEAQERTTGDDCEPPASSTNGSDPKDSDGSLTIDKDLQSVIDAYQHLTSISRPLLKDMCLLYVQRLSK